MIVRIKSEVPYSLVESAKANGIEPFAYLQHVLVELPNLGKNHSHEELESLMPWAPYIQQKFAIKKMPMATPHKCENPHHTVGTK